MSGNNQINTFTPNTDSEQQTSGIKLECGLCKTRNARELNHCSTKNIIVRSQCSFSDTEKVDRGGEAEGKGRRCGGKGERE